jgi:starvation-inducible DNA-binding protein
MFALYIKTKNFHWHVSGPHFRDYHLLLDDQGEQILATTDAISLSGSESRRHHDQIDRPYR